MDSEAFDCKVPDITPAKGNGLVYVYTLDNGMQYVGQTICSMAERHKGHRYKKEILVDNKLRVHKWNFRIIGEYPEEKLDDVEKFVIKELNTLYPNGLNCEGGGNLRKHHCEETRRKMSESQNRYHTVRRFFLEVMP